jgi:putative ABC transport system permease protein
MPALRLRHAETRRVLWWRARRVRAARRVAGVGTIALALLVCACVFIALAGPAISLRARTQALHQLLGPAGSLGTAVDVQASWTSFTSAYTQDASQYLTGNAFYSSTIFIGDGLAATPLPITAGGWGSLTTGLYRVTSATPARRPGITPQLEVTFRDPMTSNVQLVTGQLAGASVPRGAVGVAVTALTAARYGWHAGSRLEVQGLAGPVGLDVTAIVRARDPGSAFWTADPLAAAPALTQLVDSQGEAWQGAVLVDPGQLIAMQSAFCPPTAGSCGGLQLQWEFPVAVGTVNADQAQTLSNRLSLAVSGDDSAVNNDVGAASTVLTITSPLADTLTGFLATQATVLTVPLLVFISVILLGVAVIALAARMIVTERDGELTTLRARGASARQVATLVLSSVAPAAVPGAVVGAGLAIAFFPDAVSAPGGSAVLSRALAAVTLIVALAGPPLIVAWRYRDTAPGQRAVNRARVTTADTRTARFSVPALRRLMAEITACTLAIAGLVILRVEGLPPAGRVNWYLTAVPVLAAVPAVLVTLRLYPLAIRGLLRLWGHRAGVTGYLALASSARSNLATTGPLFTLALALTVAAFTGMVNSAIASGEIASSWQATGADAVITTDVAVSPVTPAVQKSIAAVPGVRHVTVVWNTTWDTTSGRAIAVAAVDPAGYAALTAQTPFPRIAPADISASGQAVTSRTVIDVLASPSAAAALRTHVSKLTSVGYLGPVQVRVTGIVTSTPARPAGGMFIIMPLQTLPGADGHPAPDTILISGSGISQGKLAAIVSTDLPAANLTFRAAVLAGLVTSPLPLVAVHLMLLGAFAAAGFGLLNLIFGLALGARDRELTLARLKVMGHEQARSLIMLQELPAVLAAVVAAAACALALPTLVGPSLDLSAFFAGSGVPVTFRPDLMALGQAAAVIMILAGLTLIAGTARLRHRDVTGTLRMH